MTDAPLSFTLHVPTVTLSREARTISGKITVFDTPTTDYRRLVLHEGALQPRLPLSRVKLLRDHNQADPLGYMLTLDPATADATFKVAEGENGDRALSEADPKNKLRDGLSVGINVLDIDGAFTYDEEHNTYHVFAAELVEVSLCAIPAYQDAQVSDVQAAHKIAPFTPTAPKEKLRMTDIETLSRADLDASLAAHREETDRAMEARLAALAVQPIEHGQQFATMGEFVQAFAAGDQTARDVQLAYTGAKSSDDYSRNTWLADAIRLVDKPRKVINAFTREPLPSQGMTLEYARVKTNTLAIAKQAAQGDDLVFGKIQLESKTASVDTYGGYTELSRQILERANSAYVTTAFKAMLIEYARATEAAARAALDALIAARVTAGDTLDLAATPDAFDWLDLLVDASERFEDLGYLLEGTFVSKDVFKRLLRLEDGAGNALMNVYGTGVNRTGEIKIPTLTGTLANVEFKILAGSAANTVAFYDSIALTTWEDSSPTQLQNTNAKNLTEAYSVYGYLAAASQFPDALVPVEFAV